MSAKSMRSRGDRGATGRLAIAFVAVVVPPALALVWMGLQLLDQDRALFAQRDLERQQAAADSAVLSLDQSLGEADQWFRSNQVPAGVVRLVATSDGLAAFPPDRLLWLPRAAPLPPVPSTPFVEVEQIEYRGDTRQALEQYLSLSRSSSPGIRAGAWLRVARMHRRAKAWDDALDAYGRLASFSHFSIDGLPADLVARRAICFVLQDAGRSTELMREAHALEADLLTGRWGLDRPSWELTAAQLPAWTGRAVPTDENRRALSAAAEWYETNRAEAGSTGANGTRRRTIDADGTPVTLLMDGASSGDPVALGILPSVVESWRQRARETLTESRPLSLVSPSGATIGGVAAPSGLATARRPASDTGLPWTVAVGPVDQAARVDDTASRQRLLMGGLGAIVLLLVGGCIVLWRGVQRELAVARLQTNFVAAVSHEFRTPLAALRHVTELLEEDDSMPADKRRSFYQSLARNTDRLHKLVESLLDFARMEDGRRPYDLRPVDLAALTAHVVDEFRQDARAEGFAIDCDVSRAAAGAESRADASSLGFALWNLLDNAVKYSPGRGRIRVSVEPHRAGIAIAVTDQGLGIPRAEQQTIFGRFVRGEQASKLGIKGTGLGLAMVSHIARAHGGSVEVESAEGAGSTFRLVLPKAA
jgi:two-component system phosphate regulon sensor histidine kinase PhoR